MLEAHGRAYRILHEVDRTDADGDGRPAVVGFAKHLVQLEPARIWFPLDVLRARIEDQVFNAAVMEAAVTGEIALAIPGVRAVRRRVPELAGSMDYFGLNYYTRWMPWVPSRTPRGSAPKPMIWAGSYTPPVWRRRCDAPTRSLAAWSPTCRC